VRFSERMGITPVRDTIQEESMDDALRNGLWNMFYALYSWRRAHDEHPGLFGRVCADCFKEPLDTLPRRFDEASDFIRRRYFEFDWHEVYDFIQFVADDLEDPRDERFRDVCNTILKREMSAYRFVGGQLTRITSEEEIAAIEEALQVPDPYSPVRSHLAQALALMSDREAPDYRNSIKESISAVEALCIIIAGETKATLGKALSTLEEQYPLHGALKSAFSSLYGYASGADGIRHALLDEDELQFEDAKFMLVACSAFVNYMIAKAAGDGS